MVWLQGASPSQFLSWRVYPSWVRNSKLGLNKSKLAFKKRKKHTNSTANIQFSLPKSSQNTTATWLPHLASLHLVVPAGAVNSASGMDPEQLLSWDKTWELGFLKTFDVSTFLAYTSAILYILYSMCPMAEGQVAMGWRSHGRKDHIYCHPIMITMCLNLLGLTITHKTSQRNGHNLCAELLFSHSKLTTIHGNVNPYSTYHACITR